MINRYILLITLLYAFQLCAQNNHFRINGRVDTRYNDSLVTLFTFTGDIIRSADSTFMCKMGISILQARNICMRSL